MTTIYFYRHIIHTYIYWPFQLKQHNFYINLAINHIERNVQLWYPIPSFTNRATYPDYCTLNYSFVFLVQERTWSEYPINAVVVLCTDISILFCKHAACWILPLTYLFINAKPNFLSSIHAKGSRALKEAKKKGDKTGEKEDTSQGLMEMLPLWSPRKPCDKLLH